MNSERKLVAVARVLLPAGLDALTRRYEVVRGGEGVDRERLSSMVRGAHALISDPTVAVDDALLEAAGPQLRVVANFAVGVDNVDLAACERRGVTVTNTPDVLTNATAELALALTLAAARLLGDAERDLRAGRWAGFHPAAYRGLEISGATVGVVGLGRIGSRYAELLSGFGVRLIYTSPSAKREAERRLGARRVDLEELLRSADVVSLHAPATPRTLRMIDARSLALMGPEAVLINTARGSLVDADALAAALRAGELGAAGLDVYEQEPELPQALLSAPRTVLLPHIGSATVRARDAMAGSVAQSVIAVLEGGAAPNAVRA